MDRGAILPRVPADFLDVDVDERGFPHVTHSLLNGRPVFSYRSELRSAASIA
jgi:hypothetical protein